MAIDPALVKSRFRPDEDSAPGPAPTLIDPEAIDISEQQFAASLEEESIQPPARFVLEYAEPPAGRPEADPEALPTLPAKGRVPDTEFQADEVKGPDRTQKEASAVAEGPCQPPDPDSWRQEVASRVNQYRGKRPREPRYPSLQLKFEPAESSLAEQPAIRRPTAGPSMGQLAITLDPGPATLQEPQAAVPLRDLPPAGPVDAAAKILAFPRSLFAAPVATDELAEPVFDRPRILEVPEVLPPPPALGGILIESTERPEDERRPGFELPLEPAPLSRRILAGMADALIVAASFAGFAFIFFRMTSTIPPLQPGAGMAAGLLVAFWAAYQYLLLVHAGSTPGLRMARLELCRFDGRSVPRRLRRWRVLASVLSGLSLGMGYAWCFLDEDELCWHDRITHTYMAPKAGKARPLETVHS